MRTSTSFCGELLDLVRERNPLVQCITNDVSMNIAANVLLAAGASPAMVSAEEEAAEFAGIAAAVTINIGTLWAGAVPGMKGAAREAGTAAKPWVLDPVAHYATAFRRQVVSELLELKPTIIRGNASEVRALAGDVSQGQGVDSRDSSASARGSALTLARRHRCIVAVTGDTDFVTDGTRSAVIEGGSPLMPKVTALGCALTCLTGAFAAVAPGQPFEATIAALALFSVCGEDASHRAQGPGSFQPLFLDALAAIGPQRLDAEARISLQ
ncbi:hydroxyethylthiazole kinase [Pseudorhizobium endolithicum]|uniref:Hydroxyethylthiazole kinase n=1 Tax=Pseudorhizobium endolithicum TaxID=1191678 RepID=A0ABM8PU59_9HYPH|nr:hydroxyethylthiazole kinase [Pseudorhizobium endolithicum]CAD7048741.1 hydroxyethylthiazole kinase [Pseudorhizobium endolithicum]